MIYFCIYLLTLISLLALSIISGALSYFVRKDTKVIKNSTIIFFANFIPNKKRGFFYALFYLILRHTWEIPQTLLGYLISQIRNIFWQVERVEVFNGVAFCIKYNQNHNSGVSLGSFINVDTFNKRRDSFKEEVISEPLLMHEYGHCVDSCRFGVFYLFVIGIPSLISAIKAHQVENKPKGVSTHGFTWCEIRANKNAQRYFSKYYSVDWNAKYNGYTIETFYKLNKPQKI